MKRKSQISPSRVTMSQIAKAAGVSRTTVSFVLNNVPGIKISAETRQRINELARELNYVPDSVATRLAGGHIGTLALILRQNAHQAASDRLLAQVLYGLSAAIKEKRFHVLVELLDPADTSATYGNLVRSGQADGVVVFGPRMQEPELDRLYADRVPVVVIGQLPNSNIPSIDVDNVAGAKKAVRHLIGLGHRRIACITNAPPDYPAAIDRLQGYRESIEDANIPFADQLIQYGNFTDESGTAAMQTLLSFDSPPTAVFVASDMVALGALGAIRAAKLRVPEDIAVVSFDDVPLAQYVDPPLTTIRIPAYGLGWGAGEMLMHLLVGGEPLPTPHILMDTELIIRDSCGFNMRR